LNLGKNQIFYAKCISTMLDATGHKMVLCPAGHENCSPIGHLKGNSLTLRKAACLYIMPFFANEFLVAKTRRKYCTNRRIIFKWLSYLTTLSFAKYKCR
jgi:hypothetical protein